MMDEINQVASLLMYEGPTAAELIQKAVKENGEFYISNNEDITILTIESTIAYGLNVKDVYSFNLEGQLIKQTIVMNGKEQIIFDKYKEATQILKKLQQKKRKVS
ncbi:hypothetical protein KQI74_23385 [Paenibacillus barcinonensis]|uniref:hypothetical protein n=1 Tax=Paenibacillus barcinonensis TaxID=198119 RepID=UPI001C0F6149|nr:hypothetical protein [Paenibacillus barcinonensis]MBU5355203.1 hypothetical protein [Paenibacillus barcinonensis]